MKNKETLTQYDCFFTECTCKSCGGQLASNGKKVWCTSCLKNYGKPTVTMVKK